ncbi:MAG: hypothetical protein U0359_09685 [Byssovorax sp.]
MPAGPPDPSLRRRSMRRFRALSTALAMASATLIVLDLPGCGGASFDGKVVRGPGYAFQVGPTPERWRRIDISQAALAFRDDAGDATIAVNRRCGVDGEDVPLASLTQHLFLEFTEREIKAQTVVPFDGREAMHSVVSAKLDGVPKTFDVWVLKKDGCVYDLYLISHPARYERSAADFDRFVHGFATVESHAD